MVKMSRQTSVLHSQSESQMWVRRRRRCGDLLPPWRDLHALRRDLQEFVLRAQMTWTGQSSIQL